MKPALPQIQVLVVDDETEIRELLAKVLRSDEVKVIIAGDGKEAMQVINSTRIDILISDIKMPKMDGFGLLNQAKQSHTHAPEVLLMTGFIEESRSLAIKMGAKGIIQKPFSGREFLNWLHMSLSDKFKAYFESRLRFPVKIPTEYAQSKSSKKFEGAVLNVSRSGLLIGTNGWVPPNASEIQCWLKTSPTSVITISAVVTWSKDLKSPDFEKGFGVDLKNATADSLQKIQQYLRSCMS